MAKIQDMRYLAAFSGTGLSDKERQCAWEDLIGWVRRRRYSARGSSAKRRRKRAAAAAAAAAAAVGGASVDSSGVLTQVSMDVHRAFHWDVCSHWGSEKRASALAQLSAVLSAVFPASAAHSFPFYVQGCHDVAGVLLLSLGQPARATLALQGLLQGPLRGCVQPDMRVPCALLGLLPRLLHVGHAPLAAALEASSPHEDALPHYALPWLLTWFAHSLTAFELVQRLFDVFLLGHPLLPLYASAALLTLPGPAAAIQGVLRSSPGDEGALFQALAALPQATLTSQQALTALLQHLNAIYAALPPEQLLREQQPGLQGATARRRHASAAAALRQLWPQLLLWRQHGGGEDPRLQGQARGGGTSWLLMGAALVAGLAVAVAVAPLARAHIKRLVSGLAAN